MNQDRLEFVIPALDQLGYRQRMMSDPETMAYNKGFSPFPGYHPETGCIDFPKENWAAWYGKWIGHAPERFYAYLQLAKTGEWVGEVSFHYDTEMDSHCVSVVVESRFRGRGYSEEALKKLIRVAFEEYGINQLYDSFPVSRMPAEYLFQKVGFRRINQDIVVLDK